MNRRQMVVLPGIALAAGRAFSQTAEAAPFSKPAGTMTHKKLARYSSLKSFYKVPKSAKKQTKYISFMTSMLALTPTQQAQAASIFAGAATAHKTVKKSMKAVRVALAENVKSNNSAGISQASASIGSFAAQRHAIGANAHAAFLQTLTFAQQTTLNQLRS